jgi:hypothetical protein
MKTFKSHFFILLLFVCFAEIYGQDQIVYHTEKGKKYHLLGCYHLSDNPISDWLSVVCNNGLTPCLTCNPPPCSSVPVELFSLVGETNGEQVVLHWSTASETNNYGFDIFRSKENQSWEKIGFIPGHGTSTVVNNYSYIDKITPGEYYYKLKQIDTDNSFYFSSSINVTVNLSGKNFSLNQNFPNPFNSMTLISFFLPLSGNTKITLYNISGQELCVITHQYYNEGSHSITFDANSLPAGLYIYKMETGNFQQIRKMMVLK